MLRNVKKILIFFFPPHGFTCAPLPHPGTCSGWAGITSHLPCPGPDMTTFGCFDTNYACLGLFPMETAISCDSNSPLQLRRCDHDRFQKMNVHLFLAFQQQFLCHLPVIGPRNDGVTVMHNMQYLSICFHLDLGGMYRTNSWINPSLALFR